ncbi:MAG TPA: hypothetical protein HA261_09365 [Methanosarcina sp.]|nr:hypothetical protein [Methanosarcina sp.]
MVNCDFCGKKINSLPFKCKFCGAYYCEDCRLPEAHNCFGLKIYNIERERKFQEKVLFVAKNYGKTDDRGYEVIVENPNSENYNEKFVSSNTKYNEQKNPIFPYIDESKSKNNKSEKTKGTTRKKKIAKNISRNKTKVRSSKNKIIYLSLLCIGVLATFFFTNNYELNDTVSVKQDLDNYLDNGISKKELPIAKASGEAVQLVNYKNSTDPTWDELISFLRSDPTDGFTYNDSFVCADFAEMLHNNAEKAGIQAGYVCVDFLDMESHALNIFNTTDKGIVFVDCTGDTEQLRVLDSKDKIAYVQIGKECGLVSAYKTNSPDYEFYEIHKRKRYQGVPGVYFEPLGTVKDIEIYW